MEICHHLLSDAVLIARTKHIKGICKTSEIVAFDNRLNFRSLFFSMVMKNLRLIAGGCGTDKIIILQAKLWLKVNLKNHSAKSMIMSFTTIIACVAWLGIRKKGWFFCQIWRFMLVLNLWTDCWNKLHHVVGVKLWIISYVYSNPPHKRNILKSHFELPIRFM